MSSSSARLGFFDDEECDFIRFCESSSSSLASELSSGSSFAIEAPTVRFLFIFRNIQEKLQHSNDYYLINLTKKFKFPFVPLVPNVVGLIVRLSSYVYVTSLFFSHMEGRLWLIRSHSLLRSPYFKIQKSDPNLFGLLFFITFSLPNQKQTSTWSCILTGNQPPFSLHVKSKTS